jgi:hypothetical protein
MLEALGCERSTQVPVWADEEDEFFNCPRSFIPASCIELVKEYDSYKDGWARPKEYETYQNRFIQAVKEFEYYCNKYEVERINKPPADSVAQNFAAFG